MDIKEQLIEELAAAGCSTASAEKIGTLYEAGRYDEMLRRMKVERCALVEKMHESQRLVDRMDRMDFLIRNQEKQMR